MNNSTALFRFATVRNSPRKKSNQPELQVQYTTRLVNSIVEDIESGASQAEKIVSISRKLDGYIKSKNFLKTPLDVLEAVKSGQAPGSTSKNVGDQESSTEVNALYEQLYDNIVVRTITKGTTNEVFKLLTDNLKDLHQTLNAGKLEGKNLSKLRIVLPERLVLSFSPPKQELSHVDADTNSERAALFAQIQELTDQRQRLQESIADHATQISAEQAQISEQRINQVNRQPVPEPAKPGQASRVAPTPPTSVEKNTTPLLDQLVATQEGFKKADKELSERQTQLSSRAFQLFPQENYALVGEKWVKVADRTSSTDERRNATIEGDSIVVYSQGCALKFPFQVADLRVVEQQSVGYLPAEIAHINNTQQGELNEKITRRLKRVETYESLVTENEVFRETDSTSTEKFSIEKAASEVQSEETSINLNASVSATYGVVTAAVDAGYSNSQSSQNANSAAQSYAKELVQRVVDRVNNKVTQERSEKTVEEFEETVKHVIDNRESDDPKSYVYRWLTLLSRATLKNYGKRLIFQIDIAHPSHYYLSRAIKDQPQLSLPSDPRKLDVQGNRIFTVDNITRENYLAWAALYNAKLDAPAEKNVIVSYASTGKTGENSEKVLNPLPDGYGAVRAYIKRMITQDSNRYGFINILIGRADAGTWIIPTSASTIVQLDTRNLNGETKFLPITVSVPFGGGYALTLEIDCELTAEAERAWQVKCYNAILEAYDNLKAEAENKMSSFDPNLPGLNPTRKKEMIKSELKKGALSKMFRCNPFWITDNYEVGNVYDPDCCKDSLNGEKVRFLETLFDWNNLTYELYPYLYADKDNWAKLLDLTDDDPQFEAFLQASFATVRIPVYRDSHKETAAVNFIMNNSIANYEVVPESMTALLDELDNAEPTKFTTGLNGEDLPVPVEVVDLGIFRVPTDLVILECGVANGVKPIGFPQTAAAETDVSIPKQYSPAIIADSCPVTTAPTKVIVKL